MSKFKEKEKAFIILTIIMLFIISIISFSFRLKRTENLNITNFKSIHFYSDDNQKFYELKHEKNSNYVPLNEISNNMIHAIISVEDQQFYEHNGFNYKRIIKSIIDNLLSMSKKYGASTITQQYARNLYLNHEKSYTRKLKEAYYTILLENNLSKDEILEGYLNTIYFGHGIYGIGDASLFYFNKKPSDLTIAEACSLAAIPKGPAIYSPITNLEKNKSRQELILKIMLEENKITKEEYLQALNEELKIIGKLPPKSNKIAPYFLDIVMYELEKYDLLNNPKINGLKVYTTLDVHLNDIIEKNINEVYSPYSDIETAVFAMDPKTGFVKAVIGGRNYQKSQYNRALAGQRHPGSTIKPLLYYAALEYGFTPTTTFKSEPTVFYVKGTEKYAPSNFQGIYAYKDVTMAYAIAVSDNIYAVKTHLYLGENTLINTAKHLGISSKMLPVPSLALGSTEMKLSELTNAYAHFANLGKQVKPVYITKITDLNDNILYEYQGKSRQVLDSDLCFILNHMLTGMFDPNMSYHANVTGASINYRLTHKYAGKSGSTDYDNTMIGFNPHLVLGVWTGYDELIPITSYEEKGYSKLLWAKIMEDYFKDTETSWYKPSKNVIPLKVNPITGELATKKTRSYAKVMYFLKGNNPINY